MMGLLPLSIASQSRAVYFPMGIDTRDYFPIDTQIARNALGIPEGKIVLLVAAQYLNDARKGIELVINSLNRLGENSRHRVVLLTMGGGHLPIKPASEIQTVSLGFVEQLPIKRLAYSAADFFINCPKSELFGLVVQESMSCGTPVIGTRVGGIPEMIDSETGHLIEPGDQGALDIVTQNIVNGKITKQSFSQKCVTSIRQKFSFEQMGESLERTYTDMLNE
jgi:glycosyltransferase involved in cell wall biosynthesis